jgi:hypothetical protein
VVEGKTDAQLKSIAKFYDYLEVQPIGNNMFLLHNNTVQSEEEFLNFSRIFPVNGVVTDSSSLEFSDEAQNLLAELELNYPSLQIKFNYQENRVDIVNFDNDIQTFEDFIKKKCQHFEARTLRAEQRIPISLNVEISPEKQFLRVERSVTIDISSKGLFVLAVHPMWNEAKKCFVAIKEFNTESLVECNIVRQIKWGEKSFKTPGLGLQIVSIHETLQDGFNMLLEKWRLN